jgi:hypothetical protein
MNKATGIALVGFALAAALSLALANPAPSLPEGVNPESWISLGSDAGFVIISPYARKPGFGSEDIHGYFVARHNGKWVRIIAEPKGQLMPAR